MKRRENARERSRIALLISSLIPVVVTVGIAVGFFSNADFMLPVTVAGVIVLLWSASPYVREFDGERGSLRSNIVGAARQYIEFHAERAGISPRLALLVVWGLWTVPALGWGALVAASIVGFIRS